MIPKSTYYSAVRKSDDMVVAKGSAMLMRAKVKSAAIPMYVAITSREIGERIERTDPIDGMIGGAA